MRCCFLEILAIHVRTKGGRGKTHGARRRHGAGADEEMLAGSGHRGDAAGQHFLGGGGWGREEGNVRWWWKRGG